MSMFAAALEKVASSAQADLRRDIALVQPVKEVTTDINGRQAIVVFIKPPHHKAIAKNKARITADLEKQMGRNTHVLIVASRSILPRNFARMGHKMRSRSLTAVHEALLEDVCAPATIVGKRETFGENGRRHLTVFLDAKAKDAVEEKLETFSAVYLKLTTKSAKFVVAKRK